MEWPAVNAAPGRCPNHDRHCSAPAIVALRREAHDLAVAASDESGELHLVDRPQPQQTRADGGADDRRFRDRRVHYPPTAEPVEQPGSDFESTPVNTDLFTEEENVRIALHLLGKPF